MKVALRECSRLIGVAQPLAGAWLRAIPGPSQFRLRSSLYVIALQRWLGLPIHMASAANVSRRWRRRSGRSPQMMPAGANYQFFD